MRLSDAYDKNTYYTAVDADTSNSYVSYFKLLLLWYPSFLCRFCSTLEWDVDGYHYIIKSIPTILF